MKKIIDLIKSLLGGGSFAEKAAEITQLETAVKEEVAVVEKKVKEVKEKVAKVEEKVKKTTTKKPKTTK